MKERELSQIDALDVTQLPEILGDFYFSLRKQPKKEPKKKNRLSLNRDDSEVEDSFYKNSSLRSARAALNRHFKSTKGVDNIANELFLKTNEIFSAVTKQGKIAGRGEIKSKEAITDPDMSKLSTYFLRNMQGPPNGKLLQEIVLFNVIYNSGRRGRENLRCMTKKNF